MEPIDQSLDSISNRSDFSATIRIDRDMASLRQRVAVTVEVSHRFHTAAPPYLHLVARFQGS